MLILLTFEVRGQTDAVPRPRNYEENQQCLKCHGKGIYQYTNEELGIEVKDNMCMDRIIDTLAFFRSNHKDFKCTDCHSPDYSTFPHPRLLRMEMIYTCMDCHGGDPEYAEFNFEAIENAYYESMHFNRSPDAFTCWSCHNPHYYKTQARSGENIIETIAYDNNICISCHADVNRYQLLTERERTNILTTHEWLPNQELHFKNGRCIECHTLLSDSLLISHVVMPKENAIRECTMCHSENSLLMSTLYRYQTKEARQLTGFINAVILNESYVIGANRNHTLNVLSVIIFGLVLIGILIHSIIRIIKRD
jgi:predicted CXXCH cytochrome family protein